MGVGVGLGSSRNELLEVVGNGVGDIGQSKGRVGAQGGGEIFAAIALDVGDHHPCAFRQKLLDDAGTDA